MSFVFRCVVAVAVALSAPSAGRAQSWTSLGEVALSDMESYVVGADLDSLRTVDGLREVRVTYVSPRRRQFSGVEFDFTVEVERYDCGGRRFYKFRQDYFRIGSAASLGTFQERDEPSWIDVDIPPNVADLVCRYRPVETSGSQPDPEAFARAARDPSAADDARPPLSERLGTRLTDMLGPELD